jgi:diguanylate cyclase (GGDEF)-like protein
MNMASVGTKPETPRRWTIAVVCATAVFIGLFTSICWIDYTRLREERVALTLENGQRVLFALRDHTMRLLDYSDSYARSIREHYVKHGDDPPMSQYLKEIEIEHGTSVQGSVVIGKADGSLAFSSNNLPQEAFSADGLPYFEYFRANPKDGVFIDPTRAGKISKQMRFRLVRPIIKDNALCGFVTLNLLPEHFTQLFEVFNLGPHSFTAILSTNHHLIARQPSAPPDIYGKPLDDIDLWPQLRKADSGHYITRSPIDGLERHILYTRLPDYPIVIDIGISQDDITDSLSHTRTLLTTQVLLFAITSILSSTLILFILRNNEKLTQAEKTIRVLANTDSLTALKNRRSFFQTAEQEFARATRYDLPLAVMMIDADHFKAINDSFGHLTGDEVLRQFVKITMGVLRESDDFGRLGGEEFAILSPQTTLAGAEALAERVRETIAASTIETDRGPLRLTVSIGVSARSSQTASFNVMLQEADDALYRAKEAGRNKVVLAAQATD